MTKNLQPYTGKLFDGMTAEEIVLVLRLGIENSRGVMKGLEEARIPYSRGLELMRRVHVLAISSNIFASDRSRAGTVEEQLTKFKAELDELVTKTMLVEGTVQ